MEDKILQIMEYAKMNSGQFAHAIGVSQGAMSNYVNKGRTPSGEVLVSILNNFPDINPDWLMLGKGEMLRKTGAPSPAPRPVDGTYDLFSAPSAPVVKPEIPTEGTKTHEFRKEIEVKTTVNNVQPIVQEIVTPRETPTRKIDRIMVFYSNQTHESFVPEK